MSFSARKEWSYLLVLMLAALLVRGFFLTKVEVILPDEAHYVRMGEGLAQGKTFAQLNFVSEKDRGYKGQPFLPLLYAFLARITRDPLAAAQWSSVILAVLTLIPFHLSLRQFLSSGEALGSDLVYVLAPFAIQYSLWAMPHALFNLLFVLTLFFLLKSEKSKSLLWPVLAGMAASGAYLTRVEGVVFGGGIAIALALLLGFRASLGFLGGFSLLSFPFWIWLRQTTGLWQLTWTGGLGASGILVQWKLAHHLPDLLPSVFLNSYFKNLHWEFSLLAKIVPLLIWMLIAIGIWEVLRRNRLASRSVQLISFFGFLPLAVYPIHVLPEPRFIFPAVIPFLMFVGPALDAMVRRAEKKGLAIGLFTGLLLVMLAPGYRSLWLGFKEEPPEQKLLGEWIQSHFERPQVLFGSDCRACFYAGSSCERFVSMRRIHDSMPDKRLLKDFLIQEGVDLVAADERYVPKFYPRFKFLLEPGGPTWLKQLADFGGEGERIIVYQFERKE